jgi:hypothetical protein
MAYVPGFRNDIFISYAHGDDEPTLTPDGKGWVSHFRDRLATAVRQRLGAAPASIPKIWIDQRDLASYVDFDLEIHDQLDAAVLLTVVSPSYRTSEYCDKELRHFLQVVQNRHAPKFRSGPLANSKFAFKAVPVASEVSPGLLDTLHLNDVVFYEGEGESSRRFAIESRGFADSLHELEVQLCGLLKKMRAQCRPIFLWPRSPSSDSPLRSSREKLANELADASYRILPELAGDATAELNMAEVSVFLLGNQYDAATDALLNGAQERGKPWIIWQSPEAKRTDERKQREMIDRYANHATAFLDEDSDLKGDVLPLVRDGEEQRTTAKRVYVVFNSQEAQDLLNGTYVVESIASEFEVERPERFIEHRRALQGSGGVLLVWGTADPGWYAEKFAEMSRLSNRAVSRGVCLFDPEQNKTNALQALQSLPNFHVIPQFESFDPQKLKPFLEPLRQ